MGRNMKMFFIMGGLILLVLVVVTACAVKPLPKLQQVESHAFSPPNENTRLAKAIEKDLPEDRSLTGIVPLSDPLDAFVARSALLNIAEESIDIQYYIWRPDTSGIMLFYDILGAAERGVRVRLLLDDNNTQGMDDLISVLDSHPNIEVRLFNPFTNRKLRFLGYLIDLKRLNHRMHNKSLIVDGKAAITGGRNIGDEYFAAGDGMVFSDLDVIAIGQIVPRLSQDFDHYWNSVLAYPAGQIITKEYGTDYTAALDKLRRVKYRADVETYQQALRGSKLLEKIMNNNVDWQWSEAILISDPPSKALGVWSEDDFYKPLVKALGKAEKEIFFVSPYFVPTGAGAEFLEGLVADGITVSVLTNAYEATDVPFVHAGYTNYRQGLVEAGVDIYELKKSYADNVPEPSDRGLVGSSASSLHAKTFVVDSERLFIGSLNLDPRSAKINTEMGVVILNDQLTQDVESIIKRNLLDRSYKVISEEGKLRWQVFENGELVKTYDVEPNTNIWQRGFVKFLTWLPIEWLL
ncbi:hypothetical protein DC083_08060 [Ignatzschineria ureiclastica]|uniref:PLD phosphodiesterase domain-containing protein n=2 Tax=Ignatzschineria ureiclastica TaxID=472582 RepID=A0A2U2AD31_9GAMM|nr:hypothetical protein DC083_08060 [Ignatzschineria ureiclastica]